MGITRDTATVEFLFKQKVLINISHLSLIIYLFFSHACYNRDTGNEHLKYVTHQVAGPNCNCSGATYEQQTELKIVQSTPRYTMSE